MALGAAPAVLWCPRGPATHQISFRTLYTNPLSKQTSDSAMKSIFAVIVLSTLAAAQVCTRECAPSKAETACVGRFEPKQLGSCWACCETPELAPGVCTRICAPTSDSLSCGEGWQPKQTGNCWTCCRNA